MRRDFFGRCPSPLTTPSLRSARVRTHNILFSDTFWKGAIGLEKRNAQTEAM